VAFRHHVAVSERPARGLPAYIQRETRAATNLPPRPLGGVRERAWRLLLSGVAICHARLNGRDSLRIGQGFDVHQLVEGRRLIIGGVEIPFDKGLLGHSDADVLLHAITDALLGAAALGDIGRHFSDSDAKFKNIDSRILLRESLHLVRQQGFRVVNVDATIIAQAPKMAPHIEQMVAHIAADLRVEKSAVNVKATTTEQLGYTGRGEGIAAQAVILLVADQ